MLCRYITLLVTCWVLLLVSCSGGPLDGECLTSEECQPDSECLDGRCQPAFHDDADLDVIDGDIDEAEERPGCAHSCGETCCIEGEVCFRDRCVVTGGTCGIEDEPCQGDTTCVDGLCIPYGDPAAGDYDPSCTRSVGVLVDFIPEVQCEWPADFEIDGPSSLSVRVPPTVADLDGDGQAEFSTAGNNNLSAFDLDCVGTDLDPPDPSRCLEPGGCKALDCLWADIPIEQDHTVVVVVDGRESSIAECHEDNNGVEAEVRCPPLVI